MKTMYSDSIKKEQKKKNRNNIVFFSYQRPKKILSINGTLYNKVKLSLSSIEIVQSILEGCTYKTQK